MSRNLSYQFRNAIDKNFNLGIDKHAFKNKHNGETNKVFSFGERKNLSDTSFMLGKYVTDNYPNVKLIKDIQPQMLQNFLNEKAKICTQETLNQYVSRIKKLELVVNKTYNTNANWKDIVAPESLISTKKIRNIQMDKIDLRNILDYCYKNNLKSKSVVAIELTRRYGLRVSECCKLQPRDIDLNKMQLHIIDSKGGRNRTLNIQKEDVKFLKDITKGLEQTQKIVNIKEESVNQFLNRIENKIGVRDRYKECKTGMHSIRKLWAQTEFDNYRKDGLSRTEAMRKVSVELGHGKNRTDVVRAYISNIH